MNTNARIAMMDLLQTIDTLNTFGEQVKRNCRQGSPLLLAEDEQLLLKGAFTLMRRTLDTLTPLVWTSIVPVEANTPKTAKRPSLHLVK